MRTRILRFATPSIFSCLLLLLIAAPTICSAEDSAFRIEFITNYKTFQFKAQEELIKKSGDIMPDEIYSLIIDAMDPDLTLGKKMFLLDAASAMAYGYDYYHGGGKKFIRQIDKLIKAEIKKEEERNAKIMKWKKEERFLGNFVMKTYEKEMKEAGLAPVLYPHWVHRIWYECSVCHQDIFIMKRWQNEISQEKIVAGKQCGVCHNGKTAFAADDKEQCDRCHIAGKPGAEKLHNAEHIDHDNIAAVAKKVGAEWHPDKLPDGRLPVDKYGFIDWLKLKREKIFNPIQSLDPAFKQEIRNNQILFISKSKLANVLFSHNVHSSWIRCSSCHPAVFADNLENNIKMVRMSKGDNCGHCHGKVSFTFADCTRCHSQEKGKEVKGALLHIGQTKTAEK